MAHAVVHIGMPKTGSTSIQAFLGLNKSALAEQGVVYRGGRMGLLSEMEYALIGGTEAGVLVMDTIERAYRGIETLEDQAARTAKAEEGLAQALDHTPDATFVMSSEHIGGWLRTPDTRKALDTWLRARFETVRYVMFIRPMDRFLLSVYSEAVKRGETYDLDHFIAHSREQPMAATAVQWSRLFPGRVSVHLMPGRDMHPDIFEIMGDELGVDVSAMERPVQMNPSLSGAALWGMRWINWLLGPAPARGPLKRRLAERSKGLLRRLFIWAPPLRLTQSQTALVRLRHPRSVEDTVAELARARATPEHPIPLRTPRTGTPMPDLRQRKG